MARPGLRISRRMCCIASGLLASLIAPAASAQRGDTTIVRVGQPLHPGVATLVEELTLGNGSSAPEYTFTHAFLSPGRDGSVYVIDLVDPENVGDFRSAVRRYDRDGKVVQTFGRVGQGPGEYRGGIGDVRELPDGRVLLSDARGLLVYSRTGEFLARWAAPSGTANMGSPILVTAGGFVYTNGMKPREPGAPRGGTDPRRQIVFRLRADGTIADTIVPPQASFPEAVRVGRVGLPFAPRPIAAWSPLGGFITANTGAYVIDVRLAETRIHSNEPPQWSPGDRVLSIRHSVPPVPVQQAERDDWRQSITMFNRSYTPGPNANWQWEGPDIPTVKPPIRAVQVDATGRIWVRLSQPARVNPSVTIRTRPAAPDETYDVDAPRRWVEPFVFDVFEQTGRYVGRVRFPDNLAQGPRPESRFAVQGDTVWAVVHDGDDVPTVKRYRIQWGR